MTEAELRFSNAIKEKIEKYSINTTYEKVLTHAKNKFVETVYPDGTSELIDIGCEKFLYKMSPLLFLEKWCFFDLPGVGRISCKHLYYFQKEILKDFTKYQRIVLCKSRQVGLSTLTSLIFFWKAVCFSREWLVVISKDAKSSQEVLEKIKTNFDCIPPWLGLKITKNNTESCAFSNRSKIDSFARSKSAGRGCSPTMALLDECAFYTTDAIIQGIVSSVVPSLSKTGGRMFVISTPNGNIPGSEGYWYYNQVRELKDAGGVDGSAKLYDVSWWEIPDMTEPPIPPFKGFNEKVQEYIDRDYFNHPEVKREAEKFFEPIARNWKDNDWLKFQHQSSGEVKYRQEILKDFVIMENTVFSAEIIERARQKILDPISMDKLGDRPFKNFWIWKHPVPGRKYIISVDVAKGSSSDSSTIEVLDMDTLEQCAEYLGKCTTFDLARYCNNVGVYYNTGYIVLECNSIGEATFSELYYNLNYPNLYKQKKVKDGREVWTGWMTTPKSRELICSKIIDYFYEDELWEHFHPHSERLIGQLTSWIWKGGRPDHQTGGHDDTILALAIGLFNVDKAKTEIINDDDTVFIDENGNDITYSSIEKKKKKYLELEERGINVKNEQRKIYANAGISEDMFDEGEDIMNWLLS